MKRGLKEDAGIALLVPLGICLDEKRIESLLREEPRMTAKAAVSMKRGLKVVLSNGVASTIYQSR
jgi:hypothetical protein